MATDILTVMWKEWKSLLRWQGRRSQAIMAVLSPLLLTVYLPWQEGAGWTQGAVSLFLAITIPLVLVGITAPDAFAGERERHTLPTLLASRLPDRAILFGKLAVTAALGWVATLVLLLASLIPLNIIHGQGQLLFFTPLTLAADVAISLLLAVLTASAGVLISLRAESVQQAQQMLMSLLMMPPMVLGMVLLLLSSTWSAGHDIMRSLLSADYRVVVAIMVAVLLAVDLGLLWGAMARFRRARLL